jgi:catechol 2,3-dioxygenase-like lactoylglutathione lyase family enzyme
MSMRALGARIGLASLLLVMPAVSVPVRAQMTPEQRQAAAAAYTGTQLWRHTLFTADMDRTIKFWTEGLGYTVRQGLHDSLGGPGIEQGFGLKPGTRIKLVILDPGDTGGVHIGVVGVIGQPLKPFRRDPTGAPQAGESFVTVTVRDQAATMAKLKALGFTVRSEGQAGKHEGRVTDPDGNSVLILQLPPAIISVVPPVPVGMTPEQRKEAAAHYTGSQIWRYAVFTPDMDRSIKFWTEGLGYTVRPGLHDSLGGPGIEEGFRLKPGSRIRLVILDPGDTGRTRIGLVSLIGQPLNPIERDPEGAPQAGETFELMSVRDQLGMVSRLRGMGFTVRREALTAPGTPGGDDGAIISPEGNIVLISQDRTEK